MVHSRPSGHPGATARRRVAPERQPLRPAIALAILSLVTMVLEVAGIVLVYVAGTAGFFEGVMPDPESLPGEGFVVRIIVMILVILVFVAIGYGLKLASLILGILVVVRGDGKLRIGAALLLAVAVFGLFFSFSVDAPMSGGVETAFTVLVWAADILRWVLTIAGFVLLGLGIREVRRARTALDPGLR